MSDSDARHTYVVLCMLGCDRKSLGPHPPHSQTCCQPSQVHVSQQPWVRGDYHDIQVSLSRMMSQLHSAVLKGASQQQQEQQRLSMDLAAAAAAGQGPDLINLDPEMAAAASVAAISAAASAVSGWGEDVYGGGGGGREGASGGARSTGGGGSESDALPFNSLGGHERWECFTRKFWVRLEDLAEVRSRVDQNKIWLRSWFFITGLWRFGQ